MRRLPYLWVLLLPLMLHLVGGWMNASVELANKGLMPIHAPASFTCEEDWTDARHTCETADTRLKFLDDRYFIRHMGVYSLGDFLLYAFQWIGSLPYFLWLGLMLNKRSNA